MPRTRRRRAEPSRLIELVVGAETTPLTAAEAVLLRVEIAAGEAARRSNAGLQAALQEARADAARWLAFIERGFDEHMQFGVVHPDGTTEMLPCADWCYACKLEKAQAERDQFAAGAPLICSDERHEAKVRGLEAELARLHEGEKPYLDERIIPTPAQVIWDWNRATPERRLAKAEAYLANFLSASACVSGHHVEQLAELQELRQRPTQWAYGQAAKALWHHREHAERLRAALADVLIRLDGLGARSYLAETSIDGPVLAWWRKVLDESGPRTAGVVHPDAEQQVGEPQWMGEHAAMLYLQCQRTSASHLGHAWRGMGDVPPVWCPGIGAPETDACGGHQPAAGTPRRATFLGMPVTYDPAVDYPCQSEAPTAAHGPLPRRRRLRPGLIQDMINAARARQQRGELTDRGDACEIVQVDGEAIRVHGDGELTPAAVAAIEALVQVGKQQLAAEQPDGGEQP